MARETGKQRSQRIQIDYYRKKGGLHTLRSVCIAVGFFAAAAYAAYVVAASGGQSHVSTGPVAMAHASFENDCNQCHQDFTPIDSQANQLDLAFVGISSEASIGRMEEACQVCHAVGDHYRDVMKPEWQLKDQNCGSCHADHQGRLHDLNYVTKTQCASCHANLAQTCKASPAVKPDIAAFTSSSHGDFASLSMGDPGTVKFDHHQHMLPGQVNAGEKGAFTIEMLDAAMREKYRLPGQADDSAVQLDCASCHQYAGNPDTYSAGELIADGELGRYIAPISFDQHCAACHSMNPGIATAQTTPIPHAVPWAKVELLLASTIRGARATGIARSPGDDSQTTAQPGFGTGSSVASNPDAAVDVASLRALVEGQCLECHDQESISDQAIASALAGTAPPMIPPRWFQHGLYDHAAHRQVDCRYCHDAAYPIEGEPAAPPTDHETVMIAGIESCTGCHRDAESPTPASITDPQTTTLFGGQPNWASDHCTMCHRYHTPVDRRSPAVSETQVRNGRTQTEQALTNMQTAMMGATR